MDDRPKYYLTIIFVFTGLYISAQVNDASLWLSLNVEKKITPSWSVLFTEEVRMFENITEVGVIFSDLGIAYRIDKRFKLSANYRFIKKKQLDDSYETRQRYYFDFSYREKLKPFMLTLRSRFQSQYAEVFSSPEGAVPELYFREKLTLKLEILKRITPYVYTEFFFPIGEPERSPVDNLRLCAGMDYSFNKSHAVDLFYMIQREYNVNNPVTYYIIGLGYYFVF